MLDTFMDSLEQALNTLVNGDFQDRWAAAKQLKDFGDEILPVLIELLDKHPNDPELQCFIVQLMGDTDRSEAILALVKLLHTCTDETVNQAIAQTLAGFGPAHLDCLINCKNEPQLHLPVVKALARMNHPTTIEGLFFYVDHSQPDVRAIALEALGQFHTEAIKTKLLLALRDVAANVRVVALKALAMRTSSERDPSLSEAIAPLLYDINPKVCQQAAYALGRFDNAIAIEALWSRLQVETESSDLTVSLIQALGWSSHPLGIQYLLMALDWGQGITQKLQGKPAWSAAVFIEILRVLSRVHEASNQSVISQKLTELLNDSQEPFQDLAMKRALVSAIGQLGQIDAIETLIGCLKLRDDGTRFHIIAALKQIGREQSYEKLQFLLKQSQVKESKIDSQLVEGINVALREW